MLVNWASDIATATSSKLFHSLLAQPPLFPGLVYWSNQGYVGYHLNAYNTRQDVVQATYRIPFLGDRTNTTSALEIMRLQMFRSENGDRSEAPNVGVVLTDGHSNIYPELTIPSAIRAKVSRQGNPPVSMLHLLPFRLTWYIALPTARGRGHDDIIT